MKNEETSKILLAIATVFSNFRTNEITLPTWHRLLKEFEYKNIIEALDSYIATGKEFAPTPGQLIQILKNKTTKGEALITPDEAWEIVVGVAASGCSENSMKQAKERCPKAIKAAGQIGWYRIRYADLERELAFVRRDFIDAYERGLERDDFMDNALPLDNRINTLVSDLANKKLLQ